jgi:glutamyl-tRNA synthetase
MKEIGISLGFTGHNKDYKANPDAFKGSIGAVAEILRITLSGRKNSPNLYFILHILGIEEIKRRFANIIENI